MTKYFRFKVLLIFFLTCSLNSCKLSRFVYYNFADINDHKIFPNRSISTDSTVFIFPIAEKGKFPKTINIKEKKIGFDNFLEQNETVAFLIIKNDTLQYEKYFSDYNKASIVPSFSMAKSVTSILIGQAIDDGLIKSVDEPVTNYIPELKEEGFDKVTIEHLLQMTSGLDFNESYTNPFGDAATFYYGTNLRKAISKMELDEKSGQEFEYESGNTQLLGLILERALKDRSISDYLEEKIWQPLGMEYNASWSLDREENGLEKTFCCINARARDYAKLGRLYLNHGNWNNKQIISEEWVKKSTAVDTTKGSAWFYQYHWWLPTQNGDFMAQGILGQYIYVNPKKNLIIVRLGKKEGEVDWGQMFVEISEGY